MAKGISRELIVGTALDLLDEQGIDGVTARALAQRLGVKAPALYWHMSSKQEILDEMGTEISRRVALAMSAQPSPDTWRAGLATYARLLRREYLAHRDGARTFSGTKLTDPGVLRLQEPWLERWTGTGMSLEHAVGAAQLVTAFVVGFVIEEQERAADRYLPAEREAALGDDVPLVRESGRYLFADTDDRFEVYLDVILTGVAVRFAKEDA